MVSKKSKQPNEKQGHRQNRGGEQGGEVKLF